MSCMAFLIIFSIHEDGSLAPFLLFLTLWLRTIPSLDDFVVGDRVEFLLCPIRAPKKHLAYTEQYCPEVSHLLVSVTKGSNGYPRALFCFGLD